MGNGKFADFVMNLFPNGSYSRVVHFTDPVVDFPSILLGFKHAGNEIWYFSPLSSDFKYIECVNRPGEQENRGCSQTLFLRPFFDDHRSYLSERISLSCKVDEPPRRQVQFIKYNKIFKV